MVVQEGHPASLAVDSANVWYVDAPMSSPWRVMRASKSGGAAQPVWTGHVIGAVAADDQGACWVDANGVSDDHAFCLASGASTPVDLGAPPGVQSDYLSAHIIMTGTTIYWSTLESNVWKSSRTVAGVMAFSSGTGGNALALDGDAVWVATSSGARRIESDGTVAADLSFATRPPADMAICGGFLYAALGGTGIADGSIVAQPTSGGTPTTIASSLELPVNVVCDATNVYVFLQNRARIVKCSASGGGCSDVATAVEAGGLAIDTSRLFWTNTPLGTVDSVSLVP